MPDKFGAAVLVIAMLFFLMTTLSAGLAPERFGERLDLTVINPGGVNEIRAQYAGLYLAAASVCAAALAGALARQTAFVMLAAVFGGLIAGSALLPLCSTAVRAALVPPSMRSMPSIAQASFWR